MKVCYDVKKFMNIGNKLSCFTPIWGNISFKRGTSDVGFQMLSNKVLEKGYYFYIEMIHL